MLKVMASHEGPCATMEWLRANDRPMTLPQFTTQEIRAVIEEARDAGRRRAAHVHGADNIRRVVQAGIDSIEHGNYLDRAGAREMAGRGAFLIPTFSVHRESSNTAW